jgi:aspartate aminotransferase-like enzyme/GNAT superfamily N-acetyltransferase
MHRVGPYTFQFAESAAEMEQVHRLNHRTFVREIPQHADPGGDRLVDKFHDRNTYLIAKKGDAVVGMLAAHSEAPFSVASRLPDPAILDRDDMKPVEIRLLAVEPDERQSPVAGGLVYALYQYAQARGFTHFVISGVEEQVEFYSHIGFQPLGPAVGSGRAKFVPMLAAIADVDTAMGRSMRLWEKRLRRHGNDGATGLQNGFAKPSRAEHVGIVPHGTAPVCLLPGPVAIAPAVTAAFHEPLVYHRADDFLPLFERVRSRLTDMVGGTKSVALFVGSGTLGNDAVAATLHADPQRGNGLVLVNGEFGGRLLKQARRWGLAPATLTWDWGRPYDFAAIEAKLRSMPVGGWVWGTHHETSTGVLNDLPRLVALAKRYGHRVCVDCVSSLATVPVDLTGTYLATGASGKAVGSYAGIAFVFADPADLAHLDPDSIPQYLDVPSTLKTVGPRFTAPSPLIKALDVALERFATSALRTARFEEIRSHMARVRRELSSIGLSPLADVAVASPAIVTFAPPAGMTASSVVNRLMKAGFQIAGQSGYLAERDLVQVAVMGDITTAQIEQFLMQLRRIVVNQR